MKKALFLLLCILCSLGAMAQKKTITGVVTDGTGESVIGASVLEVGTMNGVITDLDGKFSLSVDPDGKIQISYIGYKTEVISVKGKTVINVKMVDDSEMLQEVVVTGYGGKQLRTKVTNSISKVNDETLKTGLFSNPAQALSGAVSGLKVIQSSGSPGATPTVILRGGTNLDGTGSPLVIVDGQLRDGLNDINPEDIESMDVLKDAGATALYGARASNGVILITTKSGKVGKAEINFKAKMGFNYASMPYEFLNAGEYISALRKGVYDAGNLYTDNNGEVFGYGIYAKGALDAAQPFGTGNVLGDKVNSVYSTTWLTDDNKYLLQRGWQTIKDPITGKDIIFKDTDIASHNLNNPSFSQDYNINFSGGNDRGTYYAGLGYNKQEGLPINTFYERYSFVTNASYKITQWLTSNSSLNYNRANWKNMPGSNTSEAHYFGRVMSIPPTVLFEDIDGNPLLGAGTADGNQAYQPDKWQDFNQTDKFTMVQSFQIDILKNLYVKASANWYYSEELTENFTKDYEKQMGVFDRTRTSKASYYRDFRQTYNAVLNWNQTFAKSHNLNVMLGTEYYDKMYRKYTMEGQGAPTDDFGDLDLTSTDANKRKIDSEHTQLRILSFFGRLNYDYKEKYLLSAVFRRDGYSSLLGDNRWGFFPGVSAGWIFGRESFIQENLPVLSFGKLRASYGLNGNASGIGAYQLQGSYNTKAYNGNTGYLIGELPNAGLRWEKTATFEVGLDLSFFENRLNTNVTYYNRLTSDKYADLSFPTTTGFSAVKNNNGKLRNSGVEIEVSGKIFQNKDWLVTAGGNIAYNKNKIVALPSNGLERNRAGAFQVYSGKKDAKGNYEKIWVGGNQEGQEPNMLYLYGFEGIYKSYDEIPGNLQYTQNSGITLHGPESWKNLSVEEQRNGTNIPIQPGDAIWKDVNGDGIIDQYDKVKVGNTNPHWTGGFNTSASWKGLKLSARFDFALDFWIYEKSDQSTTPWYMGCMQGTYNVPKDLYYQTWSESNPNGTLPRFLYADQVGGAKHNYTPASTMFAYKGNYLAIREISLSYTLPQRWVNTARMQRVELSVTGQNLGYITAAKNVATPEVKADGIASSGYSLPRSVLFGINVTF